jgi:hypothetical protein
MSYTTIAASQTDSDSPLDQTLMDAIRTNLDDHETRISSLFAFGNTAVIDDFLGKDGVAPDTGSWTTFNGGGSDSVLTKASSHSLNVIANGGATSTGARATDGRIGMHMANHELTSILQFRIKANIIGSTQFWGWQDRSLADNVKASTLQDCIGLQKGTGTTFKATFANGGSTTTVDSLGTPGSFQVWRITTTCSATAGNRIIRIQVGNTEALLSDITGSPWTNTAQMPVAKYLVPSFAGKDNGAGNGNWEIDYVLAYTTTRPLAP